MTSATQGPGDPGSARLTRTIREQLRRRRAPNFSLINHQGQPLRFYDDILKNRKVLLNVMYSGCSKICTPATRNLLQARKLLRAQAIDLQFVSMTLTPLSDSPEVLRRYMALHGIDPDWTYLTGKVEHVQGIQLALGFISAREGDDLLSHSGSALYCDERNLQWSHVNTLLSPPAIARMIRFEIS
jgi:protein SCO1/2